MNTLARPSWTSWAWPTAFGVLAVLLVLLTLYPDGPAPAEWSVLGFAILVVSVVLWAVLRTRRQRHEYEARLEQWVREMAVQDERLRIARELHDLVSHGFGLMIVRAATAQLADESERHLALADIERVGRSAMSELRRMLTVLRAQGTSEVPMQPLESLADLRGIVGTARKAGAEVQLTIDELGDVPAALQVTICAMVREALANVVRHAGKTSVWVAITSTESGIRVDVRDAGPSPNWKPQTGTGYGLVGLRERVKLHGGTILAQPFETGFRVTADLPLVLRR